MSTRTVKKDDSYVTKIVKYVPAESIALATGFFAAFSPTGGWVPFWVAVFAVANWCYLYGAAHLNDARDDTDKHFYFLATCAFVLWAMATINAVAAWAHLSGSADQPQRAWVLGVATGVIPMVDSLFKRAWPSRLTIGRSVRHDPA